MGGDDTNSFGNACQLLKYVLSKCNRKHRAEETRAHSAFESCEESMEVPRQPQSGVDSTLLVSPLSR